MPDQIAGSQPRPLTHTERKRAGVAYWLFVVACLAFSGAGWYLVYVEGGLARKTQPVQARIEHSEVVSTKDPSGRPVQRPLVIYSYSVGDVRYTTDRITSLARPHSSSWANQMVGQYHVGQMVTAHVNPFEPGSAFLIEERDWRAYTYAIVPLLVAIGLAAYWPWAGIRTPSDS
jgi:hypothetical protein